MILPRIEDDIEPIATGSAVGRDHAIRDLYQRGWQPSEDDEGDLCHIGTTVDGRPVIGLHGEHPVISLPSVEQAAEAMRDLLAVAQVATG